MLKVKMLLIGALLAAVGCSSDRPRDAGEMRPPVGDLDSRESITFVTVLYEHLTALLDRPTKNGVHLNALSDDLAASQAETVSKAS